MLEIHCKNFILTPEIEDHCYKAFNNIIVSNDYYVIRKGTFIITNKGYQYYVKLTIQSELSGKVVIESRGIDIYYALAEVTSLAGERLESSKKTRSILKIVGVTLFILFFLVIRIIIFIFNFIINLIRTS